MSRQPRNPIIPGFNPDPSIIRVRADFFLCTSSFEYSPGLPIYHSEDLVNWRLIGHALTRRSQLSLSGTGIQGGVYAATLRYHKGVFYLATSNVYVPAGGATLSSTGEGYRLPQPRGFYVWTRDIWDASSWSDPIYFDVLGIDQDLFFDEDDTAWLTTSLHLHDPHRRSGEVSICKVDLTTGRSLTSLQVIRRSDVASPTMTAEGSHLYRRGKYCYLLVAEGGTDELHQEWVFRSSTGPLGPWERGPVGMINPVVFNGDYREVQNTGHMDLVEGVDGKWWAVLLAVRPYWDGVTKVASPMGRETFLCPVEWVDDWPILNHREPVSQSILGLDPTIRVASLSRSFQFTPETNLALDGWVHPRDPISGEYDLTSRPGSLALHGGPYSLFCDEAVTMALQKQTASGGVWRTDIDFDPIQDGVEAGVVVWLSKWGFASLGVGLVEEQGSIRKEVVFTHTADGVATRTVCAIDEKDRIRITIRAEALSYAFAFEVPGSPSTKIDCPPVPIASIVRTKQVESFFTGVHFGLYATGAHDQGSLSPAYFSNVSWTVEE